MMDLEHMLCIFRLETVYPAVHVHRSIQAISGIINTRLKIAQVYTFHDDSEIHSLHIHLSLIQCNTFH